LSRICLVVQSYYLRDPRVRREAESLASAGCKVDVICLREKGLSSSETVNGVNITRVPIARRRATTWRYMFEYSLFFIAVSLVLAYRLIAGRRYDLIHVNNMPDFLVFSTILPKLFGSKILLDVHDPMAEVFMSKYDIKSGSLIIRLLRWQEKISLRYCHHVLTVSDVMKERLQRIAGYTPVSVVLNVPDEAVFRRSSQDMSARKSNKFFTLLYTGTMSARYGLAVAIEAAAKLKDEIPGLRLRLVGEGDDLPALRQMVDKLSLNDVVEFWPPVPLSEIPNLVRQSDIGISPHVNDVFMALYFSTKVAEFVNMGLPTVVTRTETIERYFDDQMVRYCEAENVESFASAVLDLYHHPELREKMSHKCHEFGKRWSWAIEKLKYLEVVARLVGVDIENIPHCKGKVLILVENLSVPFDRRVWAESRALTEAGYQVSVICPTAPDDVLFEVLDDVAIYRYPAPRDAGGLFGYLWEFAYSMWAAFRLSWRVYRSRGFDVIQACNPPDTFFFLGGFYKTLFGKKYIFDHHDLSPELYAVRFNKPQTSFVYRVLRWLERRTFRTADVVISTNESFRQVAIKRGDKDPDTVIVVRNGPDISRFKPVEPRDEYLMGRKHMVCYVGVMAAQDGLEYLLNAIDHVVHSRNRTDITFTLIGSGDRFESLQALARELKIEDYIVFTGRIRNDELLAAYLSTADVCVAPDPKNELNDHSTLIKIPEYMAMGKPVVSFDLTESRYSAQNAAAYATPNDSHEFGDKIIELLDDPERRGEMGEFGKKRVADTLSWAHSKRCLLRAYELAFKGMTPASEEAMDEDVA